VDNLGWLIGRCKDEKQSSILVSLVDIRRLPAVWRDTDLSAASHSWFDIPHHDIPNMKPPEDLQGGFQAARKLPLEYSRYSRYPTLR
jgi:hypothetical protein